MDEKKQKILDKIAKLLCLAADQAGTPEGETAKEMAEKLMSIHKIEKSEIGTGAGDEFGSMWMKCYPDAGGAKRWPVFLAQSIADVFDTRIAFSQSPFAVCFIGMTGDVETCRFLFHKLMFYMERKSFQDFPVGDDWKKRQQYGQSGSIRIAERLQEIKKYMEEAKMEVPDSENNPITPGRNLIVSGKFLSERKLSLIQRALEDFKEKHQTVNDENLKQEEPIDREAWLKGYIAGSNAPINTELGNSMENVFLK